MFLCCCICSSNIFISSISDKPQLQTDTKITKSPLMITNIYYNIDGMIVVVRHTSNDVYGRWFDSIHKLWWHAQSKSIKTYDTTQQSTIHFAASRPYRSSCFCPSVTIVVVLNVQQYNCRRTMCTNVDSTQCASWQDDMQQSKSMHKLWYDTTINHPFCRAVPHRAFVQALPSSSN